jgi:hypothetical protein
MWALDVDHHLDVGVDWHPKRLWIYGQIAGRAMSNNGMTENETALVESARADSQPFADTVNYFGGDSLGMRAWADFGAATLPHTRLMVGADAADTDLRDYFRQIDRPENAAWMDNTTVLTACTLLSPVGGRWLTPLSLWDLATWFRSVVCYDRIYHHEHRAVDDEQVNTLLGEPVLHAVRVPYRKATASDGNTPFPYHGATYYMCEAALEGMTRLSQLQSAAGSDTIDGRELAAICSSWSRVLDRNLRATDLVDQTHINSRFRSRSNRLMQQMTDAVRNTEYDDEDSAPAQAIAEHNFRAQLNQRFAHDFCLPYAIGISRVPFRRHLATRATRIQQALLSAELLDRRYAELATDTPLRVPVFLALALRSAHSPEDLWTALTGQRGAAARFRSRRAALDTALAGGDVVEYRRVSKALQTEAEHLSSLAGGMLVSATTAVMSQLAQGTPEQVSLSVAAAEAAVSRLISSSLCERILWRLRRPHLLYMNNIIDQARHITNALPACSRVWEIAERDQQSFAERFHRFGELQTA